MATKKESYSEAMKRLETIVSQIESGELDIDELGNQLKEAQKLIKFCRDKLYKADEEIKKMLGDDENVKKQAIKLEYVNGKLKFAENNNRKITKSYKDERN